MIKSIAVLFYKNSLEQWCFDEQKSTYRDFVILSFLVFWRHKFGCCILGASRGPNVKPLITLKLRVCKRAREDESQAALSQFLAAATTIHP
jgi:hypothetical protein